jgi:putative membrane protein insertion efficiency factor
VIAALRRVLWVTGWPARIALISSIRLYRGTLGTVLGGRCRFFPSCSAYAEQAIAEAGAIRGLPLSVWRVIRCSPLTGGGIDYPPTRGRVYDADIQPGGQRRVAQAEPGK